MKYFLLMCSMLFVLSSCGPKNPDENFDKFYDGSAGFDDETAVDQTETLDKNAEVSTNQEAMPFDQTAAPTTGDTIAVIQTNKGTIKLKLFTDLEPKTTENFIGLAKKGYYDGVIFHRVIPGFMIQGGDPTGTGRGGESFWGGKFADEFSDKLSNIPGSIAMANAGPNTNGSQFFINTVDNSFLDFNKPPFSSQHAVFGQVFEGMDIVNAISNVARDAMDKPREDVVMEKVTIETL